MATRRLNLFTIPPGADFLPTFVSALHQGAIVPGFPAHDDPLSLAAATILVPTRRAAQALQDVFVRSAPAAVSILPRILTLGQFDALDDPLLPDDEADFDDSFLPAAVSAMQRRLHLTRLVLAWGRTVKAAVRSDDGSGADAAAFVATAPAQAFGLAAELAGLIDEMEIEGVAWDALDHVVPDEFDEYWKLTLRFLRIVRHAWADMLAEMALLDRVARQQLAIDAQIARIEHSGTGGPVIAIGSTGTNKATARLLGSLATSPRGAVVLPGLDKTLEEAAWRLIPGDAAAHIDPSAGHPQAALHRLLTQLRVDRDDVREIGTCPAGLSARAAFLTEALRPADTTDRWAQLTDRDSHDLALAGVSLIEADDERKEALSIAIALREALEKPGRTSVLITPDRDLATRVRAELARWQIAVDDSAGEALQATPAGSLALLALALTGPVIRATDLLPVLSHPALRIGRDEAEVTRLARLIEIGVARALLPNCATARELAIAARTGAGTPNAHPARRALSAGDWDAIEGLMTELDTALEPLRRPGSIARLATWATAHLETVTALTRHPDEIEGTDFTALAMLLGEWAQAGDAGLELRAPDYVCLFEQSLQELVVRSTRPTHPRLQILGLLEARLLSADFVVLGGLDEAIWPPPARTDAFLNRPMRAQLGLTPPERRIGQTAHDFVQAMGAGEVLLSRARKRGGSPTVASRLLQRMAALAGSSWQTVIARGSRYMALADRLDTPDGSHVTAGGARPSPRPPLELRPQQLSVTRIETLRRDPYAIFAERILRLKPLDPVGPEAGAREAGIILHDLLARFAGSFRKGNLPADALRQLTGMAEQAFADRLRAPDFLVFHWPRLATQLAAYVDWETQRHATVENLYLERSGRLKIPLADGSAFDLTAQADRIEHRTDGTFVAIDFKSGRVPSAKEVAAGFAPQLVLEAAMLEEGAFKDIPKGPVSEAVYVKLGGDEGLKQYRIDSAKHVLADLVRDQFEGLRSLLEQFRDPQTPYLSKPYPQYVGRFGDYDHLARVREWSASNEGG